MLKLAPVNWQSLSFIQSDDFKELAESDKHRIKASLLTNAFVDCFTVWGNNRTGKKR